jgi:hypothetical protein
MIVCEGKLDEADGRADVAIMSADHAAIRDHLADSPTRTHSGGVAWGVGYRVKKVSQGEYPDGVGPAVLPQYLTRS